MGCEDTISGPMIVPFFLRLDRTRKRAKSPSELGQDLLDGAEVASVLPVSPQSRWGAPAWMMWPKPMGRLETDNLVSVLQHLSQTTSAVAWGPHQHPCCPLDPLWVWNTSPHLASPPLPPPLAFASPPCSVSLCALHKPPYLLSQWYQFMLPCSAHPQGKNVVEIISCGNHKVGPVRVCAGQEIAIFLCPVKSHLDKKGEETISWLWAPDSLIQNVLDVTATRIKPV